MLPNLFLFGLLLPKIHRKNSPSDFRNDLQYHNGRRIIPHFGIFLIKPIDLLS
jgi:hypothetical protein